MLEVHIDEDCARHCVAHWFSLALGAISQRMGLETTVWVSHVGHECCTSEHQLMIVTVVETAIAGGCRGGCPEALQDRSSRAKGLL